MVEQGDIIKIEGIKNFAVVISKNIYNESGKAVVCPVMDKASDSLFEVEIDLDDEKKYVASDCVRQMDLDSRGYHKCGRVAYNRLIYIIDMSQSVIDY